MIVTFVGISGSGKSRLCKQVAESKHWHVVSPDELRRKLTGNISDQSKNREVFELAHDELRKLAMYGEHVIFDATNLKKASLDSIVKIADETDQQLTIYVMMDSANIQLCKNRIELDLRKGIDRAGTAEMSILEKQHAAFENMLSILDSYEKAGISIVHYKHSI